MSRFLVLATLVLVLIAPARADEEPVLPAPVPVPPEVLSEAAMPAPEWLPAPGYHRVNRYDVWQYYGVDRQGRFKPRVIYSPFGPYYLYNGAPFPYTPVQQRHIMPYIVD